MQFFTKKKERLSRLVAVLLSILTASIFFVAVMLVQKAVSGQAVVLIRPLSYFDGVLARVGAGFIRPSSLVKENDALREANTRLLSQLAELEAVKIENEFLRSQLHLTEKSNYLFIDARIIGFEITPTFAFALLNIGSKEGVKIGSSVLAESGFLVGRVTKISEDNSRVFLLSDPDSRVAVTSSRKISGVVSGRLDKGFVLDLVPLHQKLKPGDILVSSGIDGLYPPDIPVGVVSKIISRETDIYQRAEVEPAVNPEDVQRVLVLLPS